MPRPLALSSCSNHASTVPQRSTGFVESIGLEPASCLEKMKMLSVVSLAAEAGTELSYTLVASTLDIAAVDDPNDELPPWVTAVEEWIIRAIAAGLIEARLDQRRRVVLVSRAMEREFTDGEWQELGSTVGAWKDNVQRMLMVIESARDNAAV
eukprot:SAG11_NODE_5204_length_1631_cov_1.122715_2_plen_153_part_00